MDKLSKLSVFASSLAFASFASGDALTFNLSAGGLRVEGGTSLTDGFLMLAVDTGDDGFALPSETEFLPDADDVELHRWNYSEGSQPEIPGEFTESFFIEDYDTNWAGLPIALFWFPGKDKGDDTPGDGAKFGVFADPASASIGDPWLMPAGDDSIHSLLMYGEGTILSPGNEFVSKYVAEASWEEGDTIVPLVDVMTAPEKSLPAKNTITWGAADGAQGYTVQRSIAGANDWMTLGTVSATDPREFPDENLTPGFTYVYRVIAENSFGSLASFDEDEAVELFSERSQFRGVSVRSNLVAADEVKHVFGGVILADGAPDSATTRALHMQVSGNDTNNASGNEDGVFLADPTMNLYDQFVGGFTHFNDDWLATEPASEVTEMDLLSEAGRGNVFNADADNRDSALLDDHFKAGDVGYAFIASPYAPAEGVTPKANYAGSPVDGEAVVSIYDAEDIDGTIDDIRIRKLSARGHISDSTYFGMIGGIDIEGNVPKTVLVLGKGPHLETDDTTGGLAGLAVNDPVLRLRYGGTLPVIAENDDWASPTATAASGVVVETDVDKISAALVATGNTLFGSHPKDSVMLLTLDPGTYTIELVGLDGGVRENGLGFIEIEEVELPN